MSRDCSEDGRCNCSMSSQEARIRGCALGVGLTSKMSHGGKWRGACVSRNRDIYRNWLHRLVRLILSFLKSTEQHTLSFFFSDFFQSRPIIKHAPATKGAANSNLSPTVRSPPNERMEFARMAIGVAPSSPRMPPAMRHVCRNAFIRGSSASFAGVRFLLPNDQALAPPGRGRAS